LPFERSSLDVESLQLFVCNGSGPFSNSLTVHDLRSGGVLADPDPEPSPLPDPTRIPAPAIPIVVTPAAGGFKINGAPVNGSEIATSVVRYDVLLRVNGQLVVLSRDRPATIGSISLTHSRLV
jgi:hypothetical protein